MSFAGFLLVLAACGPSKPGPAADAPAVDSPVGPDCADTGDTASDTAAPDTAGGPSVDTAIPDTGDPSVWAPAADIVVYAVRHAEKESEGDDPGLTEEGHARAQALAEVLAGVPLDAIYATELSRTQLTVTPTAAAHDLPIVTDIDPEDALAQHILCTHAGETVLHAGHSYTLPDFFDALGIDDTPSVSGYGQLWMVRIGADGTITVDESRFGD